MKRCTLSLVFPFLAASAFAQLNATINVTDLGTGAPLQNATVMLDGNFQSTDAAGQAIFAGLADNTYEYTVSAACYTSGLGSITIAGTDGDASLALVALTTNNVFFFVGSPLQIMGASVTLYDGADYNYSFVTSDPFGDMVADVPYGEYSYSITIPCYQPVSGTLTVACNNGDGIAAFAEPLPATANNVFFFVGSPMQILGATVNLTDSADYNYSFVTSSPFGDMVADVPFGEYSYTITTPCYEPVSGTVTVECINGDGIAVFTEPVEIDIDLAVTLTGSVLTAAAVGLDYQWVDCDNGNAPIDGANGQGFEPTVNGSYAVTITSGDCSQTSLCTAVTITGFEDGEGQDAVMVFPNPFNDMVTVRNRGGSGTVRVAIFNMAGQVVVEETRSGVELLTIQTAHLPSGSYTLRLTTGGASTTSHLVK